MIVAMDSFETVQSTDWGDQEQRFWKMHPSLETSESEIPGLFGPIWRQWRHGCHMAILNSLHAKVHGLQK